jgi:hypothetical protein
MRAQAGAPSAGTLKVMVTGLGEMTAVTVRIAAACGRKHWSKVVVQTAERKPHDGLVHGKTPTIEFGR